MFLRKVTKLKNIGKFHKGGVQGGEYGKFTLFYAGNGRGKTTLCAVLRSLKTGSATLIEDRRTLGETNSPEAQLLLDIGVAAFVNGKWSKGCDAIHIFDGTFVTSNVHAGEEVSTDHRRSLYRIIVGPKGVGLAEELDGLEVKVSELTAKITAEKKALQQHVPAGTTFEKFLGFAEDAAIDTKIADQKVKIKAAAQAVEIAAKPLLKEQPYPALPPAFEMSMGKTVVGVSADSTQRLEKHLATYGFGDEGEAWLSDGLRHVHEDSCPFCANSLKGNALVELYRRYFDEAYGTFKAELVSLQTDVLQELSEASALKALGRYSGLAQEVEFWRAFGDVEFVAVARPEEIVSKLAPLFAEAKRTIEAKIAAPLDVVDVSDLRKAAREWQALADELAACNASLAGANTGIRAIKAGTAAVSKAALETTLRELETINKRYAPEVKALADQYNALVTQKNNLVADKDKKKKELDAYDASVLPTYHKKINAYLTLFGVGFCLMKSEKNYVGKTPQWMYTIEINKHAVDVTKKAGFGEASFQTTMSAGDRSTLALAFFMAQVDLDPDLKNAIVVFDDPFTSLDEFRRAMTAKAIFRVGQSGSQVIVLSHDKYFLKAVSDVVVGAQCATFQISSTKKNSSIEAWDLEREVKDGYLRAHMDMLDFHNGTSGTASDMRLKMRPLLEDYIRYRFPNQIPEGKWLGEMLGVIAADPDHPLQPIYTELDDINQFTAPHHHNTNTPFNDDEVRQYVARTLTIVGGC